MGIYDRDYYRREGPSLFSNWVEGGTAWKWLIGANVVCFLLQMLTRTLTPDGRAWQEPVTDAFGLDVSRVLAGEVWRVFTYGFLHSVREPQHILFNMLALWWFGKVLEEDLGTREFLAFYLVSIVASGLAYAAASQAGIQKGMAIGASGGVMAVLVLCALYHPRMVVYLFFVLPVPIWGVVVLAVAKDTFDMLGRANNGIGYTAHLGGAAFGLAYHQSGMRLARLFGGLRWPRRRPALRIYREEEPASVHASRPAPPAALPSEHLEAQVDAILEKISRTGKESLTEGERQVLLKASEAIKKRRS